MYKASIEIEAPPTKIFEFLTDPKRVQSWQPDVVETRPLPPGGLHVGTHFGATVKEYGRRFDVDLLVAAMTRNEHIAYRMEAPRASAYVEYWLVQWGRYTRVVSSAVTRPKGLIGSLYPLMKGVINRLAKWKMESRLKLLRHAVESHA
jgi:uncharacterized protein YndB with AHSA1/START domain